MNAIVNDVSDALEYETRVSARARTMRLRMLPCGTLELVLPRGADPRRGHAFVREKRAWIDQARDRLGQSAERPCAALPDGLRLAALNEHWHVHLLPGARRRRLREDTAAATLRLSIPDENLPQARLMLKNWLRRRAATDFAPMLDQHSSLTGLAYKELTVRMQRTRWGSCSSRGTISLNATLLFLSRPLVDYVMLHELAHTRHMNHSPRFWNLLAQISGDYGSLERELRQAGRHVPAWVYCRSAGE